MEAYDHFKKNLITHALSTINAFEVDLSEGETQRSKERNDLLKKIEQLESEALELKTQNQEWACKYEALNARLQHQLLPKSDDEAKGQGSEDQPTLRDFACLLKQNKKLRRKLQIARGGQKLREHDGSGTRETRFLGLASHRSGHREADDQRMQPSADHGDTEEEFPGVDHENKNGHPKAIPQKLQSHVANAYTLSYTVSKQIISGADKGPYGLLPLIGPTKFVEEAVSPDTAEGLPTPVSESCKEQQCKGPGDSRQTVLLEEPLTDGDDTSSETQFSIPGKEADLGIRESAAEDSDSPVIVSERSLSLKRKRGAKNEVNLPGPRASRPDEAGSPGSKKVKVELGSSSPCGDTIPPSTNRATETMDLDEVGSRMKTPKKSRQSLLCTPSPENEQIYSSKEVVDEMLDDNCGREFLYGRSQSEPVTRILARSSRRFDKHPFINACQTLALQPKDANLRLKRAQQKGHQTTAKPHNKRRLRRDHRSAAIAIMAEDGEVINSGPKTPSRGDEQENNLSVEEFQIQHLEGEPSSFNRRLDKALNEPPAQKPFLTPLAHVGSARDVATPKKWTPGSNQTRQSKHAGSISGMTNRTSISNNMSQHALPMEHEHHPRSAARRTFRMPPHETVANVQQDKTLRSRPLESLVLGDFVMNPNARMSYAFDEPVRSRQQRKCLPTCTKLECCGTKFLKVAEIGGVAPFKSGLWSSSPPNEEESDEALLLEHLNHDHAQLRSMARTDKENMLLQIKARQMGNAIGKHKLTGYERAKTPPGFWRADMPSTQEVEEDRQEAKRLERQKVRERWHEAMAEDGKGLWKFRDE